MHDSDDARQQDLQKKLRKLRRRQQRQMRTAWADGFLTGVCGALRPGDTVIDLGANVGDVSDRLLRSGAQVIAFEPEPWAVTRLQDRFADNPRFQLHAAAAGTEAGTLRLYRAEDFDANQDAASVKGTLIAGGRAMSEAHGVDVPVVDFVAFLRDHIAAQGPLAFLKMDIEGAELDLLDALETADLIRNVRCMVVETHEAKFKHLRPRYAALRDRMAAKYAPSHVCLDWI